MGAVVIESVDWEQPRSASELAEIFNAALASALETMRAQPSLFDVGTVIQLYGSVLRLVSTAEQVREVVGSELGTEPDADRVAVILRFFNLVDEFSAALARLDAAVIEIYQPGLVADIDRISGGDTYVYGYFNHEIAPRYGIEPADIPAHLRHFMAERQNRIGGPGYGERLEYKVFGRFARYPFEPLSLVPQASLVLTELISGLMALRDNLAAFVRTNFSLAELAQLGRAESLTLGVVMGDNYSNIHNANLAVRSVVNRSFNKAAGGDEQLREALERIAKVVQESGNAEAAETFEGLTEELEKPERKKSVLRALWTGLVQMLPAVGQMTDVAGRIEALVR
jgi:hypothetical protein